MKLISTIYVSQHKGASSLNGFYPIKKDEQNGPVDSIETALDIVADLRKNGNMHPVTISVTDDIYFMDKPVEISNSVNSVTIEPFNKTFITGAVEVCGFEKDILYGVECYSTSISDYSDLIFSDFYINGKAAKRTRYPQEGFLTPLDVENRSDALHSGSKWFIAKDEDFEVIKDFKNLEDAYISYNHWWIDEHSPIESFDAENKKITMKYNSRFSISNDRKAAVMEYIIENVGEMLKNPGEWYFDKKEGKLYYIPETDDVKVQNLKGYIPFTDKFFIIKGEKDNKVKNIFIRNFSMSYTKGEYKSPALPEDIEKGIDGYASDCQSVCSAHGGIEFEYAYGCRVENCIFTCLGVHCINIKNGCSQICITGNNISQTGAGGISISGGEWGSNECEHTFANVISDNKISHCGNRYFAACGILLRHTYENTVSHNEISYLYYSGISCGWVWGYADSICHDNIIEKNHIHHLGQGKLSDMGGVYTLGKQPGTVVRNNLIHDIQSRHYGGWGIYTDEGSSYITIENNICYNVKSNACYQHYGCMNTVRNNIFSHSESSPVYLAVPEEHVCYVVEKNIVITNGTTPFLTRESIKGKEYALELNNNFVFDIQNDEYQAYFESAGKKFTYDETIAMGIENGAHFIDPEFKNLALNDFELNPDSKVFELGFKPIDMLDVGPRK